MDVLFIQCVDTMFSVIAIVLVIPQIIMMRCRHLFSTTSSSLSSIPLMHMLLCSAQWHSLCPQPRDLTQR